MNYTSTNSSIDSNIYLRNSLDADKLISSGFDERYDSQVMTGVAEAGDYLVSRIDANPSDNVTLNFSVIAIPLEANFLAAIPVQKVAYLKDVKPNGTNGGTFTAGSWQTRDLNTIEGDSEIVTLNANQFSLGKGKYTFRAELPTQGFNNNGVGLHKGKLFNITKNQDEIIGSNSRNNASGNTYLANDSVIEGSIVLTSTETFELRHRCTITASGNGFGAAVSFGVDELYTRVKITKIK
jgi:hypothetical protein